MLHPFGIAKTDGAYLVVSDHAKKNKWANFYFHIRRK